VGQRLLRMKMKRAEAMDELVGRLETDCGRFSSPLRKGCRVNAAYVVHQPFQHNKNLSWFLLVFILHDIKGCRKLSADRRLVNSIYNAQCPTANILGDVTRRNKLKYNYYPNETWKR
jgi:hypothetical protein